ncbi:MAG: hypothetical protein Q4F40_09750, partial [Akkermansia sp.]|nr:hypothetical protein [Akkermansia sp.]
MNFDPTTEKHKYAELSREDLEVEIIVRGELLDNLLIERGYDGKGYHDVDYSSDYRYWNKTRLIDRLLVINQEIAGIEPDPPPPPPIDPEVYEAKIEELQNQLAEKNDIIGDLQSKLTESQVAAETAAQGAAAALAAAQAEAQQATTDLAKAQAEAQQ